MCPLLENTQLLGGVGDTYREHETLSPTPGTDPSQHFHFVSFFEAPECQTELGDHPSVCLSWASELLLLRLIFETCHDGCSRQ